MSELFDHMGSGVVVFSSFSDSHGDFLIADINRKAEQLERVKKTNIIGKAMISIFPDVLGNGIVTEKQIRYLAHHDQLTGIANRHLFIDRLSLAIAISHRNRKKQHFFILI